MKNINTSQAPESRKEKIISIFERVFAEFGIEKPKVENIRRALIQDNGDVISQDFFVGVHSEMEHKLTGESKRAIIVDVNGDEILIAHELKSPSELPTGFDTSKFQKIITGADVHKT